MVTSGGGGDSLTLHWYLPPLYHQPDSTSVGPPKPSSEFSLNFSSQNGRAHLYLVMPPPVTRERVPFLIGETISSL